MKHQVSTMDGRSLSTDDAPDRAVVQVLPVTGWAWETAPPSVNLHDWKVLDYYVNCRFDPIDDGNDEDDYFDPTDPYRRLGPSSTCMPGFAFVHLGDTVLPFAEGHLGNAEGPGLRGSRGIGTWVESRFNLERFCGRRARLRFLNTDIKVFHNQNWGALSIDRLRSCDDGIWIDDVQVTNTLLSPVTISVDDKPNTGLPGCGATCNTISPVLWADPAGNLAAPGQVVELSALDSVADRCLGGMLSSLVRGLCTPLL